MQKQDGHLFVMEGAGTSLLNCSLDKERNEMTVMCPGCGCTYVASGEPGVAEVTLEHEHECRVLTLMESFGNQGVLYGS